MGIQSKPLSLVQERNRDMIVKEIRMGINSIDKRIEKIDKLRAHLIKRKAILISDLNGVSLKYGDSPTPKLVKE